MNLGISIAQLGYEISPIILTNGVATGANSYNMMPIVAYTEAFNLVDGVLSGLDISLDNFFAHFRPLPGTTLVNNAISMYPFANQTIAANAMITQPLQISLLMVCPMRGDLSYASKMATMINFQNILAKHNSLGGTYSIITPTFLYTNCLMTRMTDVSGGETKQAQWQWQLDFIKPLVSSEDAETTLSSLMSKIESGASIGSSPSTSGTSTASASFNDSTLLTSTGGQ